MAKHKKKQKKQERRKKKQRRIDCLYLFCNNKFKQGEGFNGEDRYCSWACVRQCWR